MLEKRISHSRATSGEGNCFIKIIFKNDGSVGRLNKKAYEMFGQDAARADVLCDPEKNEIHIIKNNESGQYKITKIGEACRISMCALVSEYSIDCSKRYEVAAIDNGVKFYFDRLK